MQPGDFVSYYARARDLTRGKQSSQSRSDIFFLEVKPFEQEFTLAPSQGVGGGGAQNHQIDDLVQAQKDVIVATWKMDRRSQSAGGARSEDDVRSVARAESELKTRVEGDVERAFRGRVDAARSARPGAAARPRRSARTPPRRPDDAGRGRH